MEASLTSYFRVVIAGAGGRSGEFRALSATQVSRDMDPLVIRQGGSSKAFPVRHMCEVTRIRIEVPVIAGRSSVIDSWWRDVTDSGKVLSKRVIDIIQTDSGGNDIGGWRLKNAWPCKMGLSPLSRDNSTVPLKEFYDFVYEEIEKQDSSSSPQLSKSGNGFEQVAAVPRISRKKPIDSTGEGKRRKSNVVNDEAIRAKLDRNGYAKLESERARELYRKVDELDFSTKPGEAILYSGIETSDALRLAKAGNKKTIEMTIGGKWLHEQKLFSRTSGISETDARMIWRKASARYAQGIQGDVTIAEKVRPYAPMRLSAFRGVENPIFESSEKVSRIFYKGIKT